MARAQTSGLSARQPTRRQQRRTERRIDRVERYLRPPMTASAPFFSVITPTYNRGHMVGDAINNILLQEEQDFELIVIDDGSSDNTNAVLGRLCSDYRVRLIRNHQNLGRSASRNRGIEAAQGLYLSFLDSDDVWLPQHLSRLRIEIERRGRPCAVFYTGYRVEELTTRRSWEVVSRRRMELVPSILEEHIPIHTIAVHRAALGERALRLEDGCVGRRGLAGSNCDKV